MTSSQVGLEHGGVLPPMPEIEGGRRTLSAFGKSIEQALQAHGIDFKPLTVAPQLKDLLRLYTTRLPDPIDPDQGEVDFIVAAACGEWTEERVDAFIEKLAPRRVREGLPLFHIYSTEPTPPELSFLFETVLAGIFEIMAWEVIDDPSLSSQDCIDLAAAGRELLENLYDVSLDPDDLQWLSVVNQVLIEEFRWFSDDPDAAQPDEQDYTPHASLLLLGAVAGEAIRLNHTREMVWTDAEGMNWPRLGRIGTAMTLPVFDTVLERFESGQKADLWEMYELFFATGRLSPPMSLGAEVNPLDFLPAWDPEPDADMGEAVAHFEGLFAEAGIHLEAHPDSDEALVNAHIRAYTCYHDDQAYDLFVSTAPWDDALSNAFLRAYGHRALEDWEMGKSPVFVFFSGHALNALLEYCFIQGPPVAPLEGLARVETPSLSIPNDLTAPDMLALWLADALERYSTIGLDLGDSSVVPALEFFLREDLRYDPELTDEAERLVGEDDYVPEALVTVVGVTVGSALVGLDPDRFGWTRPEGSAYPLMTVAGQDQPIDLVTQARAIWQGTQDAFILP